MKKRSGDEKRSIGKYGNGSLYVQSGRTAHKTLKNSKMGRREKKIQTMATGENANGGNQLILPEQLSSLPKIGSRSIMVISVNLCISV